MWKDERCQRKEEAEEDQKVGKVELIRFSVLHVVKLFLEIRRRR